MKIDNIGPFKEIYPVIPVLRRQGKNCEFRANLGYVMSPHF